MTPLNLKTIANLQGIGAIFLWSSSVLWLSYANVLPAFLILSVQHSSSFICMFFAFKFLKPESNNVFNKRRNTLIASLGLGLYALFFTLSFQHAPVSEAALINYLWPIFLVILTGIFVLKSLRIHVILGSAIAFLGIAFLKFDNSFLDSSFHIGHALALCAAIIWAVYSVIIQKLPDLTTLMPMVFLILGVLFAGIHLAFEPSYSGPLTPIIFSSLLGITSGSACVLWNCSMQNGDVNLISVLSYFIPVLSIVLLAIFGQELLSITVFFSLFLLVLGTLIVSKDKILDLFKKRQVT